MRQTLLYPLHFSLPHYATQACMLNATAHKQRQGLTLNKIIRIASYSKYKNQITFQEVIICCLLHKNSVIKIRLLTLFFVKAWYIYVICQPGGPYQEKLCQRSWVRPKAAVFPNTDRPRLANNVFIFFFRRVCCKQFLCWIFTAAIFKPGVRVRLTFRK